ncbi:hypothetical protein SASPL_117740 [Salvia splendens]|uniref:Ovate family protein n=1 Tax=Salvia splendens TaxID=180675 RepID=A0A8X8Y013_SALSN|nr:hypothetical protein SASPL_117740 [Salvia splendens]
MQPFPNSNPRNPLRWSRRSISSSTKRAPTAEGEMTPSRLSVFKKLISCTVVGKVKENFAIVKKSENPLEDFKRSMMDMRSEMTHYFYKLGRALRMTRPVSWRGNSVFAAMAVSASLCLHVSRSEPRNF